MPTVVVEKQEIEKTTEQRNICRAPIALYENGESYILFVELPGADETAVQVRLDKGLLTIEAPLKLELPPGTTLRVSEVRFGDYRRTLEVGDQVDEEKIEASFKSGLLRLMMPKSKTAKARKIPVKFA
jgi:HSP20 family protein